MTRQGHRCRPNQPRIDVGLVGMHVHPGRTHMARVDGIGQGFFVNEAAPSDVHETRAALELRQRRGGDEGLAGKRGRDQDTVGDGQHVAEFVVEVGLDHLFLGAGFSDDVIVHDVHAKSEIRLLGNGVTNVPQADDSQCVAARVVR